MLELLHQYVSRKAVLLALLESLLIALALLLSVQLRFWNNPAELHYYTLLPDFAAQVLTAVFCFEVSFYYNELYHTDISWAAGGRLSRYGQAVGFACLLLALIYLLYPQLTIGRGVLLITLAILFAFVFPARNVFDSMWKRAVSPQTAVILGDSQLAHEIALEIQRRASLPLRVAGVIRTRPFAAGNAHPDSSTPVLGDIADLHHIVRQHSATRVIVADESAAEAAFSAGDLIHLRTHGVELQDGSSVFAALTGRIPVETIPCNWLLFSDGFHRGRLTETLKRALDVGIGAVGLVLSAPVMVLIALAIKLDSRGPVLYRQTRLGRNGKRFEVLKFRSMRVDAESAGGARWAQKADPRVTRLGRILRRYRFDELPQFVNVIRGDMSFVGPRPERPEFVERLGQEIPFYDERHTIRPGLTGWAQVCYPYGASVEDAARKLEYDLFYLKNMSVVLDCAIIFLTVKTVLMGEGAR